MNKRLQLHNELIELVGNENVYFQPPASVELSYPCVIYSVGTGYVTRADDMAYNYTNSYEVMFIFKQPNLDIIERVLMTLPMCNVSRVYVADNLNHYVFNLYY